MMKIVAAIVALVIAGVAYAYCTTGYLQKSYSETVAGQSVTVCVYSVNGDYITTIIPAHKLCPLSKEFCL